MKKDLTIKKIKQKEREEHNIMESYSVLITKVPGGAQPVISNGETVAELFAKAFRGESINGYPLFPT